MTTAERFSDEANAARVVLARMPDNGHEWLDALGLTHGQIVARYAVGAIAAAAGESRRIQFVDGSVARRTPNGRWEAQ